MSNPTTEPVTLPPAMSPLDDAIEALEKAANHQRQDGEPSAQQAERVVAVGARLSELVSAS